VVPFKVANDINPHARKEPSGAEDQKETGRLAMPVILAK
jgi:hypothetical protein